MPKILKVNTKDIDVCGTSLRGYIDVKYSTLVSKFGEPHYDGDGEKTDVEWDIEFEDGTVAVIYNWKDGPNYLGGRGTPVESIEEWHIGGHDSRVESWINDYVHNSWPAFDEIRQKAQR